MILATLEAVEVVETIEVMEVPTVDSTRHLNLGETERLISISRGIEKTQPAH